MSDNDARLWIRHIANESAKPGSGMKITYRGHALDQMKKRNMIHPDVESVLRGGWVNMEKFETGPPCRYRIETDIMGVAVAIVSSAELLVWTAMRYKKRGRQ